MRLADEIEDRDAVLALVTAQPAAELLEEDEGAFRGPKEEQRVDLWQVYAFVEQVHREQCPDLAGPQLLDGLAALIKVRAGRHREAGQPGFTEAPRHEVRVRDAHAETQGPHRVGGTVLLAQLLQYHANACVVAGIELVEFAPIVCATRKPDAAQVRAVVDAEVLEWTHEVSLERVPQAHLGGDMPIEVVEDVLAVRALWRGREPQQQLRFQVVEQPRVGRRACAVKLVDDHHVERGRLETVHVHL